MTAPAVPTPAAPAAPAPAAIAAAAAAPAAPAAPAPATPAAPAPAAAPTPAAPAPAAPAAAPFTFKAPEGREFDPKIIDAFGKQAQQLGLSNESAQKLIDSVEPVMRQRLQEQVAESIEASRADWSKQLATDPEFGGEKLTANMDLARRTLAAGGEDLPKFLRETGLDTHPALIKWAAKLGAHLSPDALPKAVPASLPASKSAGEVFYPTMQKKV